MGHDLLCAGRPLARHRGGDAAGARRSSSALFRKPDAERARIAPMLAAPWTAWRTQDHVGRLAAVPPSAAHADRLGATPGPISWVGWFLASRCGWPLYDAAFASLAQIAPPQHAPGNFLSHAVRRPCLDRVLAAGPRAFRQHRLARHIPRLSLQSHLLICLPHSLRDAGRHGERGSPREDASGDKPARAASAGRERNHRHGAVCHRHCAQRHGIRGDLRPRRSAVSKNSASPANRR